MDSQAVAAMLRKDRAEWEALVASLESRPDDSLHDAGSPRWTSRDVYAHLARWIEHSTAHLEARLAGRAFPPMDGTDDEINARWQRAGSRLGLEEARHWAERAFERRLRAIDGVPAARWDAELETIARADGAEHYAGHRRCIVAEEPPQ